MWGGERVVTPGSRSLLGARMGRFDLDANNCSVKTSLERLSKAIEEGDEILEWSIMSIAGSVGADGTAEQVDEFAGLLSRREDLSPLVNITEVALMAGYHDNWTSVKYVVDNHAVDYYHLVEAAFLSYDSQENVASLMEIVSSGYEYDTLTMGWVLIKEGASLDFIERYHLTVFDLPESEIIHLLRCALIYNGKVLLVQKFLARISKSVDNYGPGNAFDHNIQVFDCEDAHVLERPLLHTAVRGGFTTCIEAMAKVCPPEAKLMTFEELTAAEYYQDQVRLAGLPCLPRIMALLSTYAKGAIE